MSRKPPPEWERMRRHMVMNDVHKRMGREGLTYQQAADAIGTKYGTLRNALVGDVAPGSDLTAKCRKWLDT